MMVPSFFRSTRIILIVLLAFRAIAWFRYRSRLAAIGAVEPTLAAIGRVHGRFVWLGIGLPVVMLAGGILSHQAAVPLGLLAGLCGLASGWHLKFALITRAAHVQGYAFGMLRKGHPSNSTRKVEFN